MAKGSGGSSRSAFHAAPPPPPSLGPGSPANIGGCSPQKGQDREWTVLPAVCWPRMRKSRGRPAGCSGRLSLRARWRPEGTPSRSAPMQLLLSARFTISPGFTYHVQSVTGLWVGLEEWPLPHLAADHFDFVEKCPERRGAEPFKSIHCHHPFKSVLGPLPPKWAPMRAASVPLWASLPTLRVLCQFTEGELGFVSLMNIRKLSGGEPFNSTHCYHPPKSLLGTEQP